MTAHVGRPFRLDRFTWRVHLWAVPKASNREKILSAGLELIHRHGYAGASVRDIVEAAGVPQGSFTNHFTSKEAFGLEVIERHYADTRVLLDRTLRHEGLAPLERLEAYLDETLELLRRGDGVRKGSLYGNLGAEASEQSEAIRHRIVEIFAELSEALERCLHEAREAGELRTDLEAEELADFILSSLQGATLMAKARRRLEAVVSVKRVVFSMLLGVSAPPRAVARRKRGSRGSATARTALGSLAKGRAGA